MAAPIVGWSAVSVAFHGHTHLLFKMSTNVCNLKSMDRTNGILCRKNTYLYFNNYEDSRYYA